jgi:hypothetical protein
MSYIEELRLSRDKAQVAFQEFALSTSRLSTHLFCFFEGKDNSYYVPRIKRYTEKYHPIKCGNKDSVLKVHKLISNHSEYSKYKKAFFIDRDFNNSIEASIPPIFETPCYSIENLYVSPNVFKEILTNEFHLSEIGDQTEFDVCISLYTKRQEEFNNAMSLFNAWYACLIDIRQMSGQKTGVSLDEKPPKGFLNISLSSVNSNYDFDTIKSTFSDATEIEETKLQQKISDFQKSDKSKIFRGKYELHFLVKFIQLLLQDANSTKNILSKKINFAFGDLLSNQQAINIFEGYAETPNQLTDYLLEVTN